MAPIVTSAKAKSRAPLQQPTPPTHDEDSESLGNEEDSESEVEKDETEEELERLVFGDKAGFRAGLRDFSLQEPDNVESDGEAGTTGLEGLDDADLFFTDLNPEDSIHALPVSALDSDYTHGESQPRQPPAWEDSDDERIMVSLAAAPRLRKLRRTEAEDVVNGVEYSRRLRQQFELLNPVPQWAQDAMKEPAQKRRRISLDADQSNSDASDEDMASDDDDLLSVAPLSKLLRGGESLARSKASGIGRKRKLKPGTIDIERQKDIDITQSGAITSLSFHPTLPLLLSSGPSSTLYLHQLARSPPAAVPNPLLTSLHIRKSRLATTAFHPNDSRIFLSSHRRFFHIWNLTTGRVEKISRVAGHEHEQKGMGLFRLSPDGKHIAFQGASKRDTGTINILDATTLQWRTMVRIDGRHGIAAFAWWRDGAGLCIASRSGEITEWDLAAQRVVARWQDEGAVGTSRLALGGSCGSNSPIGPDRWVAVGSSAGIVNVYDRREWFAAAPSASRAASQDVKNSRVPAFPKPTRMLDQLTTPITLLVFSPDGQVLAMASQWARDALRLVHLPSCSVFQNWPTSNTPLGRVTGVAFAGGEVIEGEEVHSVLAVANDKGKIRLWHIR